MPAQALHPWRYSSAQAPASDFQPVPGTRCSKYLIDLYRSKIDGKDKDVGRKTIEKVHASSSDVHSGGIYRFLSLIHDHQWTSLRLFQSESSCQQYACSSRRVLKHPPHPLALPPAGGFRLFLCHRYARGRGRSSPKLRLAVQREPIPLLSTNCSTVSQRGRSGLLVLTSFFQS